MESERENENMIFRLILLFTFSSTLVYGLEVAQVKKRQGTASYNRPIQEPVVTNDSESTELEEQKRKKQILRKISSEVEAALIEL